MKILPYIAQHVEAKLVWEPMCAINTTHLARPQPSGGVTIKGFDNTGTPVMHQPSDYKSLEFDYCYTSKTANTGKIAFEWFTLSGPNNTVFHFDYNGPIASYYIEGSKLDLDIDSDNNDVLERSDHEDIIEMDLPGKLIPVGKDNDTDLVLEFYGAPGTTVTFAIQGNVQVYRGKNGTNPIVPGTPYGASGFVFDTNTYNPYGGVTTLYVQAMTPDDNVGDSIITATMSTQSNGVTPPPDKVRATAYDVVVSWEDGTGDNGATLDGNPNGGGQRVFPEQETPDPSSLKNVVDLVFKTEPLNLGYEVTGYYKLLDPNNYAYEDADGWKGNDNYWKQSSGVKTVTIPANGIRTISGEIVEAHAGDNWIAVSSASKARVTASQMNDVSKAKRYDVIITIDDEPANRSEMLTVWRTLNVECDIMSYPGMSSSGMNPADYLGGIVEKQLARACIVIRDLTPAPNASPPSPAAMVMTKEEYYAILGWNETTEEFDENSNCGRDLFGNSKKFWTVRIVMASKFNFASIVPNVAHPWAPGVFHYETNTIVIFYESIQSHYTYPSHINSAIRWFLLHEIGHALIDDNHTPGSVMQDIIYPSYVLEEKYQKFLLQDIKKIQEYSRVNPIEGGES